LINAKGLQIHDGAGQGFRLQRAEQRRNRRRLEIIKNPTIATMYPLDPERSAIRAFWRSETI
jgi:hypothetical protein